MTDRVEQILQELKKEIQPSFTMAVADSHWVLLVLRPFAKRLANTELDRDLHKERADRLESQLAAREGELRRAEFKKSQYEERAVTLSGLRMDEMNAHNQWVRALEGPLRERLDLIARALVEFAACWQRGEKMYSTPEFWIGPLGDLARQSTPGEGKGE